MFHRPRSVRSITRKLILVGIGSVIAFIAAKQFNGPTEVEASPWYLGENIQYIPPGPEFKLISEAAAMQEQREAALSKAEHPAAQ
jgi:hypothetical protein